MKSRVTAEAVVENKYMTVYTVFLSFIYSVNHEAYCNLSLNNDFIKILIFEIFNREQYYFHRIRFSMQITNVLW